MALRARQNVPLGSSEHVVHFYEHDSDLLGQVGRYVSAGIRAGETVIAISTETHRLGLQAELRADGIDVARASSQGMLIELDAATTMATFTVEGQIDRDAFHEVLGGLMRRVARSGRVVRAYGEMVALLWDAGQVLEAIELETWWNELARELPFSLLCSYAASSVSESEHAEELQQVCRLHSSVAHPWAASEQDTEHSAPFELTAEFDAEREAPGHARRMLVAELRREDCGEILVQDAALVLTELAANAVLHANSPFSISVSREDSMLRIAVADRSPLTGGTEGHGLVPRPGRGLGLIQAVSARWGMEVIPSGKIVWAELPIV